MRRASAACAALLLCSPLLTTHAVAQMALPEQATADHKVTITGFDCANEILDVLPMLGRGKDFPAFLLRDVQSELERQQKQSYLVSATCLNPPEMLGSMAEDTSDETGQVLATLSVTFDLGIRVNTGGSELDMLIQQQYVAENLDQPNAQKVTQNFIVKKTKTVAR